MATVWWRGGDGAGRAEVSQRSLGSGEGAGALVVLTDVGNGQWSRERRWQAANGGARGGAERRVCAALCGKRRGGGGGGGAEAE